MASPAILKIDVIADSRKASRAFDQVGTKAQTAGQKLAGFARSASLGLAATAVGIGLVGKKLIGAGSDLNEVLSKSNTVFGRSGREIERWAEGAATGFGQSKREALEAASSFGNMFRQLEIGEPQAVQMSKAMTELASDFASFHNSEITEVLEAQSAAFRGEYDAVQRYVPTINAAAVEQKAMEMGLAATTSELDAQDKALATQALLLEGAGDAIGDYDRTAGGLANTQRALSAQFEDLQAKIGQKLIPVALRVAQVVNDKVLPAFEAIVKNRAAVVAALGAIAAAFVAWAVSAAAAAATTLAAAWPLLAVAAAAAAVAAIMYVVSNRGDGVADTFIRLGLGAYQTARMFVDAFRRILAVVDTVGRAVHRIIELVKDLIGWLGRIKIPNLSPFGGLDVGGIVGGRRFDNGGVMPGPRGVHRLALVAGGETILPTHRTGGFGQTVFNVNVTVGGLGADAPEIQRAVVKALRGYTSRNGPLDVPVRNAS